MTSTVECWRCHSDVTATSVFCESCKAVQPPRAGIDHFQCLGLEATFVQDEAEIARKHRALQRTLHPDRFVHKGERERAFSLQHATSLNDAFRILKHPQRRAEYLVQLRGIDLDDEAKPIRLNPMFLMEVIEFREALDELNGVDSHGERMAIGRAVQQKYEQTLSQLGTALDERSGTPEHWAQWAAQLRYLQRILDHVAESEENMSAGPLG
ncbi:MAG: Fe-S protein assembly co-chaperone HscB [Myxococcota bacterium]|nr:Fe-S protein assembly co-chaperone HscB [Myxococcota bacterium]